MKYRLFGIRRLLLCLAVLFAFGKTAIAQPGIDSIQVLIDAATNDSIKVDRLIDQSYEYLNTDLDKSIEVGKKAEALAKSIGYKMGLAYSHKAIGLGYYYMAEQVEALTSWQLALNVFREIDFKAGVSNMLSNLGAIYYNEGDYPKASDYYLQSLKVAEEIKDTLRQLTALTNIGAVYSDNFATHDKALDYSLRALKLSEIIKDQDAIATNSVNIGEIYLAAQQDSLALYFFEKSLNAMNVTDGVIHTMVSISKVYTLREEYDTALEYLNDAIKLADDLNAKSQKAHALTFLGETYREMGNYAAATTKYKEAATLLVELKDLKDLENAYGGLDAIYKETAQYDSAYKYHELLMVVKDSAYNIEVDKVVQNQMFNFQIEKKQDEINFLVKEQELKDLDLKRQKVIRNLVTAGFFSVILFLLVVVKQKRSITKEKDRSERLLLNILPYEVAEELKDKGSSDAQTFAEVSVLFTDFKGFTSHSEKLTASELVKEINEYFKAFDEIITKYKIEKIKTIGDAYMAAGGVPIKTNNGVVNVILAAMEMQAFVEQRKIELKDNELEPFSMRAGIHTGQVVAGIVGVKKFQYDIWGDTVNTASRMESNGGVGEVNISEATYNQIKDFEHFTFIKREELEVKGKGKMQMYFVRLKEGANLDEIAAEAAANLEA